MASKKKQCAKLEKKQVDEIQLLVNEAKLDTNTKTHGYVDVESMARQLGFARMNTDALPPNTVAVMCLNLTGQFSIDLGSEKLIATNNNYDEYHKRFAIAHELGHFYKHGKNCKEDDWEHSVYAMTKDDENGIEAEANRFAAMLLMDKQIFTEAFQSIKDNPEFRNINTIEILSNAFGAPQSAVKRRIQELELSS